MNKHLKFDVEDGDILEENSDSQFATGKIRAFSSGISRNETICDETSLMATAPSIDNKPILYNITPIFDDFSSHSSPDNTLIAGFIVPGTQKFEKMEDGRTSLNVDFKIWKRYASKAMEIFKRDGGNKKCSVEIDLIDSEELPNGLLNMKNFVYSGICILGDLVTEASPGAQLEMMSFAKENEEYKEAVRMEFGCYDDIDFTIPETIKKNSMKGLSLYKEYGRGATSVSLAHARFISKNDKITADKIRNMKKVFKSEKFKHMTKSPPSDEYITYMLYGGSDGLAWSEEVYTKIDEQDSKQMSYFSEELTFPYKTGEEVKKETENMEDLEKKEEMALEKPEEKEMAEEPKKEEMAEENPEEKKEEEKEEMAADSEEEKKEEEQEKKDEPEEEKKEEKMSNDQNLDVAATLTMLANETDAYANMVREEYAKEEKDYAKMFEAMCGKMCQMAEETKNLKSFKADIQKEQFDFAVNSTMKDIEEHSTMPQDKRDFLIEESKKFSLENIDGWRNLAKAEAFNFATKGEDENKELHFATPWGTKGTKKVSSLWG